jgi:hypothetical protein
MENLQVICSNPKKYPCFLTKKMVISCRPLANSFLHPPNIESNITCEKFVDNMHNMVDKWAFALQIVLCTTQSSYIHGGSP